MRMKAASKSSRPKSLASFFARYTSLTYSFHSCILSKVAEHWDDDKAKTNFEKHGVAFQDCWELLHSDILVLEIEDVDHSETEQRFIAFGPIKGRVVMVVFSVDDEGDVDRIISARSAEKDEINAYQNWRNSWP